MNYRHIYHAGNFADVIKHLSLIMILNKLNSKAPAYCVIDAFAGIGLYDISSPKALATGEAAAGILNINFAENIKAPKLLNQYLDIIKTYNNELINIYPGSPFIIESLLRSQDLLIACELHRDDYMELKKNCHGLHNMKIHHIDAYVAIKAFTPPKQSRGLIFIDPPFEKNDEFDKIIMTLKILKKRFRAAINLIWFPIKDKTLVNNFYNNLKSLDFKETILIEFSTNQQNDRLTTIGILIINPPWQIIEELRENINFLTKHSFKNASFTIKQLPN